jgi:hypothetical protein
MPCDKSYASILFEKNRDSFIADEHHGVAFDSYNLPDEIEKLTPDYSLFPVDYSLGYTFRPCFRKCEFCKVPKIKHQNADHHSIWEFHDTKFSKIKLLNNNTFFDKRWRETFDEIADAKLKIVDENGYDLRLMDDEKAHYLKHTKFEGQIHYAWDLMSEAEDIYRVQKIVDYGHDPYIMPYHQSVKEKRFKRFIGLFMWRKYKTIELAWNDYNA